MSLDNSVLFCFCLLLSDKILNINEYLLSIYIKGIPNSGIARSDGIHI